MKPLGHTSLIITDVISVSNWLDLDPSYWLLWKCDASLQNKKLLAQGSVRQEKKREKGKLGTYTQVFPPCFGTASSSNQ